MAESKNKLEALIYEIKEKVENEDFLQFVQTSEKDNFEKIVKEQEEWYDDTTTTNRHDYD